MSRPREPGEPRRPRIAPVTVASIECASCPVGCSGDYHPAEFCSLLPRDYPAGTQLATKGEPTDYVWFVKSGAVAGTWGRGHQTDVLFLPGTFIGLETLISATRVMGAWTLSPTTVCAIARDAFVPWLERRADLFADLKEEASEIVSSATRGENLSEKPK